jgi:Divergent InlB B-repeat domain
MNWKWVGAVGLFAIAGLLLSFSSCAHDQQLVSMTIQPGSFTFLVPDPAGQAQFTAIGTYIHPPASKDITSIVTWKSSIGQVATVTSTGVVSPSGTGCGGSNISASYNHGTGPGGNTVFAFATVTVDDPSTPGCPGFGTNATLTVDITGNGTVMSAPAGIDCTATTCSATFPAGSTVILTATPSTGAMFSNWGAGCTPSGNQCTVTLNTNITVTAAFN